MTNDDMARMVKSKIQKPSLSIDDFKRSIDYLKEAIENEWCMENSIPDNLPDIVSDSIRSLIKTGIVISNRKEEGMRSLGNANVRMLLLIEAISHWKEVDYDLYKHDKHWDASIFEKSLKDIMDATYASKSIIILIKNEGTIADIKSIGIENNNYSDLYNKDITDIINVIDNKGPIFKIDNVREDNLNCDLFTYNDEIDAILVVPIYSGEIIRGLILLINKSDTVYFDEDDLMVSEIFSKEISHFIERNELLTELNNEKKEQELLLDEVKRTQTQLLQSEKLASIGSLAAGIAHEINNPVGYISSNIGSMKTYIEELFSIIELYENLESELSDDNKEKVKNERENIDLDYIKEDIVELVSESEEGVRRVKGIVQDLKDFSHVDEVEWQWADLQKGLNSTLNIVHNETKYTTEIIKEYGDIPEIECIISQLNQVFMNLIVNASHAIESKGTITITTKMKNNNEVQIIFRDTGKGIPNDNLKRIFDPFFTTKPVGKGTGLGLSISFGIIEKHHGEISVDSEPGEGTVFTITLPVKQPRPMAE